MLTYQKTCTNFIIFLVRRLYLGILFMYLYRVYIWNWCVFLLRWYSNLEDCKVQYSCARINFSLWDCTINIKGFFVFKKACYLQILWQVWWTFFNILVMKSSKLFSVKILLILIPPLPTYEQKCCNLTPICFCVWS